MNIPNALKVYTDGSKTDYGVDCAFLALEEIYSWTLSPMASIYTAELYAIWMALRYCEMSIYDQFLICTDSLSCIQAIGNTFSRDPQVQNIHSVASLDDYHR